jgi:hypothetical protein
MASKALPVVRINSSDPTESKGKREAFQRELNKRWRNVRGRNREWIMNRASLDGSRVQSDYRRFFENIATDEVLESVNDRQVRRGRHWTATHITNAYDAGLRLAKRDLRGLGASDSVIEQATRRNQRNHQQSLEREYESVYYTIDDHVSYARSQVTNKLREALENDKSRTWFADGSNQLLRNRVGERYRSAANTAITRVVNEAKLTTFEVVGVTEVGVAVEDMAGAVTVRSNMVRCNAEGEVVWQTAGDARVCTECMALEGTTMKIEEVRNSPQFQPPIHPNCRCVLVATKMETGGETIEAPQTGPNLRSDSVNT